MPDAAAPWPKFQIIISSKDGTVFPSFPSSELSEGDADKIRLSDIRTRASISTKLRFTAEGSSTIADDTSLSYYMSLRGDDVKSPKKSGEATDKEEASTGTQMVKIELILSGFKITPTAPAVDPAQYQQEIEKLLKDNRSDAAKVGDLKKLSDSLGALRADSMSIAAVAGAETKFTKEPLDLTEGEWDYIFKNTRALHGWYTVGEMLIRARKQAFQLVPPPGSDASTEAVRKGDSLAMPPFHVNDDSTVEVTEMRTALQKEMADSGFSSLSVRANAGGGAMGASASGSLAVEKEHSEASKKLDALASGSVQVAYKFPRASVELDAFCLQLTPEAKKRAVGVSTVADVDQWRRDFGNVFALNFTLGGELTSSRNYAGKDTGSIESFKDSLKVAAGLSITSPYASGGVSVGKTDAKEHIESLSTALQSLRLAWQARGGNTLLCSNPPLWTSTVKDYRLWRIMDQNSIVNMVDLVQTVDVTAGQHLVNPKSTKDGKGGITKALSKILAKPQSPAAEKIKDFYDSDKFIVDEYNKSLPQDGEGLKLTKKKAWGDLEFEQQTYVGLMAYERNLFFL